MKDQVKSVEGNIKSFLSFAYCRRITRIRSKYLMGMKGRLDLKRYRGCDSTLHACRPGPHENPKGRVHVLM